MITSLHQGLFNLPCPKISETAHCGSGDGCGLGTIDFC